LAGGSPQNRDRRLASGVPCCAWQGAWGGAGGAAAVTEECVICNKRVALPEYDAHAEGCLLRLIDFSVRRLGRHAATPCGCRGVRSSDTSP
jgi:hypothetical protein